MDNIKQFLEADALLPCPFCGHEISITTNGDAVAVEHVGYEDDCFISDLKDYYIDHDYSVFQLIVKQWNTRTPDRNLLAAFEQVCEALEKSATLIKNVGQGYGWKNQIDANRNALTAAAPYRKQGGV